MKKVYEKPQVYMERFELSQNVALCGYKLNSTDAYACKILADRVDEGAELEGGFLQKDPCKFVPNIYCYTDGSDATPSIFMS